MKKILILLACFATLGICAMDVPQNFHHAAPPENIFVNLHIKNKTLHNLLIINNATQEVVLGLKPHEIKNKNLHLSFAGEWSEGKDVIGQYWRTGLINMGQTAYRIDAMKHGEARRLGFLVVTSSPYTRNHWVLFMLFSNNALMPNAEITREEIEFTSSQDLSGNERIDIDAKIVLEGEDLSQSKIEDITAVMK